MILKMQKYYYYCILFITLSTYYNKAIKKIELNEPRGWIAVPMEDHLSNVNEDTIITRYLKLVILANHNQGRDSHIRQIHIYEPCHIKIPEYLSNDNNHSYIINYHDTFDPEIFGF